MVTEEVKEMIRLRIWLVSRQRNKNIHSNKKHGHVLNL